MQQMKATEGVWKGLQEERLLHMAQPYCSCTFLNHFHKIKAGKVSSGKDVNEGGWQLSCGKVEAMHEVGLLQAFHMHLIV